jgi:serine/threonine protein kinase
MAHPLSRNLCKPVAGQKFSVKGVDYILRGKLGNGAAALVRRAERIHDGAKLAIKFLAPDPKYIDRAAFDDVAARFRREGQRAQELSEESLVKVYAYDDNLRGTSFFGGHPKNPFIIMEEVQGTTLEGYIKREQRRRIESNERLAFVLTPDRLSIAIYICQALRYLHQKKIVHRDVKPSNVFMPRAAAGALRRRAKLGDFGIVKWGDFQSSITTGTLTVTSQRGLGTLKYMSPEQAIAPKDVTVRSDMYSLGITLFELFTGQILASPHHVFEILNARLSRGNTASRLIALGYHISPEDVGIAEFVLDMHLRGAASRPPIDKVVGRLTVAWERRTDRTWS